MEKLGTRIEISRPGDAAAAKREEFARLVRDGFSTAGANLDARIRVAECLAFHYARSGDLGAIAALKVPDIRYRHDVFKMADALVSSADYRLELGWVYVVPAYRRKRTATMLCEKLVSYAAGDAVFATTRSDNTAMARILRTCDFAPVGQPYMHRGEQLRLYLRRS